MNPSQISNIQEFADFLPLLPSEGRGGDLAVDSCAKGLLLGPVALGGTMSAYDFRQLSTDPFASETPGRAAAVAQSTLPSFDSFQMEVGQPHAVGGALGVLAQRGAHGGLDFLDPSMDPAGTQDGLDFLDRLEGQAQISMGGLEALPPLDLQSFTVNGAGALDHIPVEEEAEMEQFLEEIAAEGFILSADPNQTRGTARHRSTRNKRILLKSHPISGQWDEVKNGPIPEDLTCGSKKKVWWQCEKGHGWEALVSNRCELKRPTGCPECARKAPARGLVKDHVVAAQWDVAKNGSIPEDLTCGSKKKVWWQCEKGHGWEALVSNRCELKRPTGCPECARKAPARGLVKDHVVAAQWDVAKNGSIPEDLTCGSKKKVWWQCEKGHGWEALVSNRCELKRPTGCPECARKAPARGLVKDHVVAAQWDVAKNGSIPEDLTCGSNRKFWWKCEKGHSWIASVYNRCNLKKPTGCPECMGKSSHRELVKGHAVAAQWDVAKNGSIPEDLTCGSNKKFFWKCEKEHSWEASVANRSRIKTPSGCPTCSKSKKRAREEDERVQQPPKKK